MTEFLEHEAQALEQYKALLKLVKERSVLLEEYAREQIASEEQHLGEVRKMLRQPGK